MAGVMRAGTVYMCGLRVAKVVGRQTAAVWGAEQQGRQTNAEALYGRIKSGSR